MTAPQRQPEPPLRSPPELLQSSASGLRKRTASPQTGKKPLSTVPAPKPPESPPPVRRAASPYLRARLRPCGTSGRKALPETEARNDPENAAARFYPPFPTAFFPNGISAKRAGSHPMNFRAHRSPDNDAEMRPKPDATGKARTAPEIGRPQEACLERKTNSGKHSVPCVGKRAFVPGPAAQRLPRHSELTARKSPAESDRSPAAERHAPETLRDPPHNGELRTLRPTTETTGKDFTDNRIIRKRDLGNPPSSRVERPIRNPKPLRNSSAPWISRGTRTLRQPHGPENGSDGQEQKKEETGSDRSPLSRVSSPT